jgi:hypothetical protein
MNLSLKLHPEFRCEAVSGITVDATRSQPASLKLRYRMTGRMDDLKMPSEAAPARADALWRHTCFEAFLRSSALDAYYEFNFSPSHQWAVYHFDGYRNGMREAAPSRIDVGIGFDAHGCEADVVLDLNGLPDLAADAVWHLGLTAVIEEKNGRMSYWALAHPPGKPDFHHADGFALALPGDLA